MAETFSLSEAKGSTKKAESFGLSDVGGVEPYSVEPGVASLMNIGQALTFGFGDEIAGKVGLNRDRYRETVDKFRKDYPGSAMLGSVSGSMLLPFGSAKLAAHSPYLAASAVGGLTGVAQGAGDANEMQDVPRDAVSAGVLGAALGPAAVGAVKNVGAPIASAIAQKVPVIGQRVTNAVAGNRVAQALLRDEVSAADVARNMRALGPEARLADAAGENTRNTLDLMANMPGKTQNTLEQFIRRRIAERPERMDDIVRTVSNNKGRAGDVAASLAAEKAAASKPLYEVVDSTTLYPSDKLTDLLGRAKQLGAFTQARKMSIADPNTPAFSLDDLPQGPVKLRDVDHVKRGLDQLIDRETDQITGKTTSLGRAYVQLKKELVAEADTLATGQDGKSIYKAARDAFAGPAALESALNSGRRFINLDTESVAKVMQDMTASEQEAFRVGAAEALRTKFGGQRGQTEFLNAWKDRNIREKLKVLIGGEDAKFSDVMKVINNEATFKRLESLGPGRNSRTFSREAASDDLNVSTAADLASMGVNAKAGNLPGLMSAWRNVRTRIDTPEAVRDRIGEYLLMPAGKLPEHELQVLLDNYLRNVGATSTLLGTAAGKGAAGGLLGF